jgi:hypothetical protein
MKKIFPLIGILLAVVAGSASGTYFTADYVSAGGYAAPSGAPQSAAPTGATLAPGLYTSVMTGQIVVSNAGGTSSFTAGQFGYTPSVSQAPVLVPKSPGTQFTLPPAFFGPTAPGTTNTPTRSSGVTCVVR